MFVHVQKRSACSVHGYKHRRYQVMLCIPVGSLYIVHDSAQDRNVNLAMLS